MREFLEALFSNAFMPHGHCYFWIPGLVWLQVLSNLSIGLAYVSISSTLAYIVWRIRDIPFQGVYIAFGVFIVTCGGTHFFDVLTVWQPFYWLDGGLRAVTAVASTATALVMFPLVPKVIGVARAAQAGRELERLKTDFFANVSHELRTPLALVLGPAERMLAEGKLDESQRRDLEVISRNARTLLKHVNDLLEISKLEAGKMQLRYHEVDGASLLRFLAGHFDGIAREKEIALAIDAPGALRVEADQEKLERVILNLLSNAFKFTPRGGRIRCRLHAEGDRVCLEVADSGPGVRAADRPFIFDRFRQAEQGSTRTHGGTGLGLAIVRDFVQMHHGAVAVATAAEGGALFTVSIPVRAPANVNVERGELSTSDSLPLLRQALDELKIQIHAGALATGTSERATVLVIEDHPDMNRFVSEALAVSYHVERAFDGQEGLEKAVRLVPDAIVSDVMMPRLGGDQLVQQIRANNELRNVPIVILTAKADDEMRIRLLREGAQDYVMKPFAVEELRARVDNQVTMKRARDVLQRELDSQLSDLEALAGEVTQRKRELHTTLEGMRVARDHAEQATQLKSEFLSMVSHELRTPLTTLQLHLQRMQRGLPNEPEPSERVRDMIKRMGASTDRLVSMIDSLLEYARIETGKLTVEPQEVAVRDLIDSTVEEMRPQIEHKKLELRFAVDDLPPLVSDPRLLHLVLSNLIANAVKYTERGSIEVRAAFTEGMHRIAVTDTGVGISPEKQASVFEPFVQGEKIANKHLPGVGLGLSLVREMVAALGGRIVLESAVGQGSTFTIALSSLSKEAVS